MNCFETDGRVLRVVPAALHLDGADLLVVGRHPREKRRLRGEVEERCLELVFV